MNKKEDFIKTYLPVYQKLFPQVTSEEIAGYYDEARYGGYPEEPGGSVWDSEGKSIYVLIRILKPKRILEIGNYLGVSTNHILQAVEMNGVGEVTLVDIFDHLKYDKLHNRNFNRVIDNSLNYLAVTDLNFDLYIQDACHEYEFVKGELRLIADRTKNNFHIWGHDWYHENRQDIQVRKAWTEMESNLVYYPAKDSVSNCGCVMGEYKK